MESLTFIHLLTNFVKLAKHFLSWGQFSHPLF